MSSVSSFFFCCAFIDRPSRFCLDNDEGGHVGGLAAWFVYFLSEYYPVGNIIVYGPQHRDLKERWVIYYYYTVSVVEGREKMYSVNELATRVHVFFLAFQTLIICFWPAKLLIFRKTVAKYIFLKYLKDEVCTIYCCSRVPKQTLNHHHQIGTVRVKGK